MTFANDLPKGNEIQGRNCYILHNGAGARERGLAVGKNPGLEMEWGSRISRILKIQENHDFL